MKIYLDLYNKCNTKFLIKINRDALMEKYDSEKLMKI